LEDPFEEGLVFWGGEGGRVGGVWETHLGFVVVGGVEGGCSMGLWYTVLEDEK